jgi:hypothetical protein
VDHGRKRQDRAADDESEIDIAAIDNLGAARRAERRVVCRRGPKQRRGSHVGYALDEARRGCGDSDDDGIDGDGDGLRSLDHERNAHLSGLLLYLLFPDWLDSGSRVDRSRGMPTMDCGLRVVEDGPGL